MQIVLGMLNGGMNCTCTTVLAMVELVNVPFVFIPVFIFGLCPLFTQVNGLSSLPQVREGADHGDADEDWSVDTSADAVKQRQTTLSMAAASLAITDDLELSEDDRLERLYSFVSDEQKKGSLGGNRSIFEEAKRLEVLDKGVFIVCEIVFDENVLKQMSEFRRFLLQVRTVAPVVVFKFCLFSN